MAQGAHTEAEDLSSTLTATSGQIPSLNSAAASTRVTAISRHIFSENKRPPTIEFKLPECGQFITDTPQLAYCLGLLQTWRSSPDSILDPDALTWLNTTNTNADEIDRLMALATDVITTFVREGIRDVDSTAEAMRLVPVVDKAVYRYLVEELCSEIERSPELESLQLEYLAQVIQGASEGYIEAADLIGILEFINSRHHHIHQQSKDRIYELSFAVSSVVDAMADTNVNDLDRERIHRSMSDYVDGLKATADPSLVYQAAYTYQALHHILDGDNIWDASLRRTQKLYKVVDYIEAIDVRHILQQLQDSYESPDDNSKVEYQDENKKTLLAHLKEGRSFEYMEPWYPTLRTVDALLRGGQFTEFKKLALETPCRRHPAFQWGMCQLLEDLAANVEWDSKTRLNAIAFLTDMYKNSTVWCQFTEVKELVITILTQLASLPESIKRAADKALQQLGVKDKFTDQSTSQAIGRIGHRSCRLDDAFLSLTTPSLLDRVQDTPGIENRLCRLRKARLTEQQNTVYVEPRAKAPSEPFNILRFSLMEHVEEFLNGDRKVFLLLGAPGSGKSTFSRVLERDLWKSYKRMESLIPLYIDLSVIDEPTKDPISKCLRRLGFTECQIKELKLHRKFILICDEYDQIRQPDNLYTTNKLNQIGGWSVKMLVCCRSEYPRSGPLEDFYPTDENCQAQPKLFQQATIEPFSMDQVLDYIKQYVTNPNSVWTTRDYIRAFKRDQCLQELSMNPLLLCLTLEALSGLVHTQQELSVKRFNKVAIYDQIVTRWFESRRGRLENIIANGDDPETLTQQTFVQCGIDYLKRLASAIYKNQDGTPVVEYSPLYSGLKIDGTWKDDFFSQGGSIQILREVSPLKCNSNKFQFVHPSILEYGLTLSVYGPQGTTAAADPIQTLGLPESDDSGSSFELDDSDDSDDEAITTVSQGPDQDSPLIWRNFVNDHSILGFLEDRVQLEPMFKRKLLSFIGLSTTETNYRTAAINSITILVGAGISFKGADLRGIQVPGANLSHGMFESARLQGADLRKTTLCGAWLYKANLSQAKMKGVQFGEHPSISEGRRVHCCAYSPDGTYFAIGLDNGNIRLYTTSDWALKGTLTGHEDIIKSIAFSTSYLMVSGSSDTTAKLWDIRTGKCVRTLLGHTDCVYGVAFSPERNQVATANEPDDNPRLQVATGGGPNDRTVRLWDVNSGECQHILIGHSGEIWSVTYSPNGRQVASGSGDKTVGLWDVETGVLYSTLPGHEDAVFSVAYSPQGHLIASGSGDSSVRLWDVESKTCQSILRGHSGSIRSVAFSPLGNMIATGNEDRSVRLWDVEAGVSQFDLSVHNGEVMSVVFSPKGNQVASGSLDGTVRLWNVGAGYSRLNSRYHSGSVRSVATLQTRDMVATGSDDGIVRLLDMNTGICIRTLSGHRDYVRSLAPSPADDQIVSGSDDRTVRLWDVDTGACRHVLRGHTGWVRSVAFSPSGNLVASGSDDKTIRLWNAQTGECDRTISGHSHHVRSIAFSPKGGRIVSGSDDQTLRLWNVDTGACIRILSGHSSFVLSVAFSPTGTMIASSSYDDTVRLWDASTGTCRRVLGGHISSVKGVVFSPNGDQVASSSDDKSVRVWSVASGQELAAIHRFQGPINCLAWCTKSYQDYLATGEENGALQFCTVRKLGEGEGQFDVRQSWMTHPRLDLTCATVNGVQGLRDWDKRLLNQRGAIDVPN